MELWELKKIYFILKDLEKISRSIHRLNNIHCSFDLSKRQEARRENLAKKSQELAKKLGFKVEILSDPRYGCGVCLYEGASFWEATNKLFI